MDGTILGKKYNLMNDNGGGGTSSANIAPTFSETSQYIYGDLVFYEGQLYRFEVEEHEPGPWNPEEVMGTSIDENLVMLPGDGIKRTMHEFSVKLKSDGGLHFDQNGAIYADHLPDYRLTEHDTKQTWIDGRNVYMKVVELPEDFTLSPQAWTSTNVSIPDIDIILNAFGIDGNGSYFNFYATFDPNTEIISFYQTRNANIVINKFVICYVKRATSKKKTSK